MELIKEILSQLSQYNYTKMVLLIVELIAVLYGAKFFSKLGDLKLFFGYLLTDLLLFVTSLLLDAFKTINLSNIHILNESINALVSLLEIGFYYTYFSSKIKIKHFINFKIAAVLTFIITLFFIKIISGRFDSDSYFTGTHVFSTAAFLIISPLAIFNMIKLVNNEQLDELITESDFWITIGILYYSVISTPYYYFRGLFEIETSTKRALDSTLFYTPFIINIICILIAFICKKQANVSFPIFQPLVFGEIS